MATGWVPSPTLFTDSAGAGLKLGAGLAGLVQERRNRSKLQEIADMVRAGAFEDAGSDLIGMGEIAPGIGLANVPFNRQQALAEQALSQNKFAADQAWKGREFGADQAYRNAGLGLRREEMAANLAKLEADQAWRQKGFDADQNYRSNQIAVDQERLRLAEEKMRADALRKSKTPLSVTAQKELMESDEMVQAGLGVVNSLDQAMELNDKAYDGPLADWRGFGTAMVGNDSGVATQQLKNIVTSQALESLKATFGAAPTEGERKILLEVQGSVNQPRPVRKAIFERAKAAAERRIAFNRNKADAFRSGEYFNEGFDPTVAPGADDDIDALLKKYGG